MIYTTEAKIGSLSGIRVLDATQMLAGPMAATRLGDLGADVIKIEAPGAGEFNRTHGFDDIRIAGSMSTFVAVNRNKRSLAIDLKNSEAIPVLNKLVEGADVFIQNFRLGTADRLGVGYETLAQINPRLIYCSISGYGNSGPYANRPGQDLVIQGYSGSMFSVGKESDPPTPGALWAADVMTGYQATIGILAAIAARAQSGRGQHVEVDMFSVVLDAQLQELVTFMNSGHDPKRSEEWSAHAAIPAPYGVYKTADGWLTLAMAPLPQLGEVLNDGWLRSLTDYNDGRVHRDSVFAHIRNAFLRRTTSEWIERCDECGVWAGPVYNYQDVVKDPHLISTGGFVSQPTGIPGKEIITVRPPIRMSDSDVGVRLGAPLLGEHSNEILVELGYSANEIERLTKVGAVSVRG